MTDKELWGALNRLGKGVVDTPICAGCRCKGDCDRRDCAIVRAAVEQIVDTGWRDASVEVPTHNNAVLTVVNGRYGHTTFVLASELAHYYDGKGWVLRTYPEWTDPKVTYWRELPEWPEMGGAETMAEYKDAAKIRAAIKREIEAWGEFNPQVDAYSAGYLFALAVALNIVRNAPAAEVVRVRHGHWAISEYEFLVCSVCGGSYYTGCDSMAEARDRLEKGYTYPYCPNCGAEMDGGGFATAGSAIERVM